MKEMTKNEAYTYARKNKRVLKTNKQVDEVMTKEGYGQQAIRSVKAWLFNYGVGA